MSTRGCIAIPQGDAGFKGRYQHSDSYIDAPWGLGPRLWHAYHHTFGGNLDALIQHAIYDHPAGWSSYPERCYCHWEGREETGDSWIKYVVGKPDESRCDPLFTEWVYILTPTGMDVLNHVYLPDMPTVPGNHYGGDYDYVQVLSAPWNNPEPDWNAYADFEPDPAKALYWLAHPRPQAIATNLTT